VLFNAVRGISDLITIHGLINLDFADVRTIMNEMGVALMGAGTASGEDRAEEAARMAISSPLLEDLSIDGALGVLINITGGPDLSLFEVNEASTLIQEAAHEDANIIFGAVIDDAIPEGEMRVTVIATGLDQARRRAGIDEPVQSEAHANVTPLRRDEGAEPAPISVQQPPAPTPAPEPVPAPEQTSMPLPEPEGQAAQAEEWLSPFEDELDVPTFIRKGQSTGDDDDDRDTPAFLRRSAD
jgi:cell division protein FtsZ